MIKKLASGHFNFSKINILKYFLKLPKRRKKKSRTKHVSYVREPTEIRLINRVNNEKITGDTIKIRKY